MSALTTAEREALFPFLDELELSSLERGVEELRRRGLAVRVDIPRGSLEIGYRFVTAMSYLRGLEGDRMVLEQLHAAVERWMNLVKPADYEQMQDEPHYRTWSELAIAQSAAKAHLVPTLSPEMAALFGIVDGGGMPNDPHRFPSREETAEAVCANCGRPRYEAEARDGCSRHIGIHGAFHHQCEMNHHPFVPRTSEEPTEGEDEAHTKLISYVLNRGYDGSHEGLDAALAEFEQAIARQAAAPLERRIESWQLAYEAALAVYEDASRRREAVESRVATLERELAEAREALERSGQALTFCPPAFGVLNDIIRPALARPRSTESAPEEGSDE